MYTCCIVVLVLRGYHGHHRYHSYRRNNREYFQDDFKKASPPTFHGSLKKLEDVEGWLLSIKKFFNLHDYRENMKARITISRIKGKAYIWWEGVKWVRDIMT